MQLQFLDPVYSVCQLSPASDLPSWAANEFLAIMRTDDELTIIAPKPVIPVQIKAQHDFSCFRIMGSLDFEMIGVIAAISAELARANIPILAFSTYNTDYFLVAKTNLEPARLALESAGYEILS